jgi:tRNA (cmo5U34)-methyltransferase
VSEWTEKDSAVFRDLASIAVPCRTEMLAAVLASIPYGAAEAFRVVDLGAGEGRLDAALLDSFPQATLLALDGSESMREVAGRRLARFGARAKVRAFDLATLEWWDLMHGADVVVSSLCLHHLNDAKKQYLFRAVADRLSPRGAFVVADIVEPQQPVVRRLFAEQWDASAREQAEAVDAAGLAEEFQAQRWNHFRFPDPMDRPSPLFFQLMWLKHAGFAVADCVWATAGHVVFAGFKSADAPPAPLLTLAEALASVSRALSAADANG